MSHAEAPGSALKAWLEDAERAVAEPSGLALIPAPPDNLTPGDYRDVGFKFYAAGCGRYQSGSAHFHISHSPDCQNQALLLYGPTQSVLARLWIDGQDLRVPISRGGFPICDEVAQWLDTYVSKGLLQRTRTPVRAASLRLWQSQIWHIATQEPASYTRQYPPPPSPFGPEDCKAISFSFVTRHDEHEAYESLQKRGDASLHIVFSPSFQSQAVLVKGSDDWSGAMLWVDAHEVPVPRDARGEPQCESYASWLDERFLVTGIGGLWDHPLANPTVIGSLGRILGLLLWDNERRTSQCFLPEPHEAWTEPHIAQRGNHWHIFADDEALRQDRADRIIPIAD